MSECEMLHLGGLLLGEEELVEVGRDTTSGDRNLTDKLVQLLIVLNGELDVTRNDTGFLVFASAITGQLEQLGNEVLDDGRGEDGSADTETGCVTAFAQELRDTRHGERETFGIYNCEKMNDADKEQKTCSNNQTRSKQ